MITRNTVIAIIGDRESFPSSIFSLLRTEPVNSPCS
jgi:hypothetical protein